MSAAMHGIDPCPSPTTDAPAWLGEREERPVQSARAAGSPRAETSGDTITRWTGVRPRTGESVIDLDGLLEDASSRDASDGAPSSVPAGSSPSDIIANWRAHGPIRRLATGWRTFDDASRGGLIFGHCTFFCGAPNAKKTASLACLGDVWLRDGVAVGALLVDETPEDFFMRFAVRAGLTLDEVEGRDEGVLSRIHTALSELPLRMYGRAFTIEAAAEDFAAYVADRKIARAVFMADTVQKVAAEAAKKSEKPRERVNANVTALDLIAKSQRWVVLATSEMPRAGYQSEESTERFNDMAAGKESGQIEYDAKAQLVFRSVKDNGDLVAVSVPKLKRGAKDETELHLTFDRYRHTMSETAAPVMQRKAAGKVTENLRQVKADANG